MAEEQKADATINLRGVPCPTNFVKAKLKIEELAEGQVLELVIDGEEALRNVPFSMKEEGHYILDVEQEEDNIYKFLIRKGANNG